MRPCDLTGGMSVTNDPAHESHGEPEGQKRPRSPYIGMGALIGIGAGIGVAFGAIAGSVALGLAFGAGVGAVAGAVVESYRAR